MDSDTCLYYLALTHSARLPSPIFSRLLREFGSVAGIRSQPPTALQQLGFDDEQIGLLQSPNRQLASQRQVDAALDWAEKPEQHILCYESPRYPAQLREIDAAPPLLYVHGDPSALSKRQFAMVGSRNASIYGKRNAYWMAGELSAAGLLIVSGLARGIDSQAHEGALSRGGETVAVIGTGIDRIYPLRNRKLAARIVDNGALISEFALGTPAYASNFPRRNRIISGLAEGALVVEGGIKSGSLITARLAMEQNRDVFALPGAVGSCGSRGCHQLIKQGAKLVEEPGDILEELGVTVAQPANEECQDADRLKGARRDGGASRVLRAIDSQGCLFQAIQEQCQLSLSELNTELIRLEADGLIQQQGGRYFRQA